MKNHHSPTELPERPFPEKITLRDNLVFHWDQDRAAHLVMEEPTSGRYYRLGLAEYRFLMALPAADTVEEAWNRIQQTQPTNPHDPPLSRAQALRLCAWLMANGLTQESSPQALPQARTIPNPFFFKYSVCNPDKFFARITPYLGWLLTWQAQVLGLLLVGWIVGNMHGHWRELAVNYQTLFTPGNSILLLLLWCLLKLMHEIGHGVVCKHYGGNIPDAGLALIFFAPVPYLDTTSSWRFTSHWQRMQVASAGMVVEVFLAALALGCWQLTDQPVLRQICTSVLLMASLGTLAFNLNALMRFDGYFMLADVLGIDNLYQLGQNYSRYWGKRYLLGLPASCPRLPTHWQRIIKVYGLAATLWRTLIVLSLIVAATTLLHGAGIFLALFGVCIWILKPLSQLYHYLKGLQAKGQLPHRQIWKRAVVGLAVLLLLIYQIPTRLTRTAPGIVEYAPPTILRVASPGFVTEVHVQDGQWVNSGDRVLTLCNDDLSLKLSTVQTELEVAQQRVRSGQWTQDSSHSEHARAEVAALQQQFAEYQRQVEQLVVRAPCHGRVLSRRIDQFPGAYLDRGEEIALIGEEQEKRLKISLDQLDINDQQDLLAQTVRVVMPNRKSWRTKISRLEPRASQHLWDESLSAQNGGPLAVVVNAKGEPAFCEPRLSAYIMLDEQLSQNLLSGQRCTISLGASRRTVGQALLDYVKRQLGS